MSNDINPGMGLKQIAAELFAKFGGKRETGRKLDTDYQRIDKWAKGDLRSLDGLFDILEKARKALRLSKSAMWDRLISKDD